MQHDEIVEELTGVFRDIFDDDDLVLHDDMTAADVARWTSLSHINLILAVEDTFDVRIGSGDIEKLTNVRALVALIERKTSRDSRDA